MNTAFSGHTHPRAPNGRDLPRRKTDAGRSAPRGPRGIPRRNRRGLGLFDVILAAAVLSVMALWGGQAVGNWTRERVLTGETRAAADLARAGRLLVEGDVAHARRGHGVGAAPLEIPFSDLADAGLRARAASDRTPGRRTLTLHLWRPSADALVIIARARGDRPLSRLPGAETGVSGVGLLLDSDGNGTLSGNETRLRGPGVDFDMGPLNTGTPGFATVNDLFALDYVALDAACRDYLYRVAVTGCPNANVMTVDLDMGGNSLTGAGALAARSAVIGRLAGPVTVTQGLTVTGALAVDGAARLDDTTVGGALTVTGPAEIEGTLTVEDLTASDDITGADLILNGTVTVSGTARLRDADVNTLNVQSLNVQQLSSDVGEFNEIVATDITATRCDGCEP